MLKSPTAHINDVCINGCIPLLFSTIKPIDTHRFAVFSMHDLTRIQYNASDEVLWKAMWWICFWKKDIWIIPIQRPSPVGHWVLCIAYLSQKELLLFDSLGEQKPWRADVQDVMKLITRLISLAREHHSEGDVDVCSWVARPLTIIPLQSNGYDCGIWVLAVVAATLRGFHTTGMQEEDMTSFRHYLYTQILSISLLA
ncbi:hypothetical protein PAXRUDRAFT_36366 [Paxillus rubicundulus Ve08.2h10]|uniref:Ubiquitin-like protease family profile domain-containing protein n=1 Tax=Paxillus rubicundulus Ve08.2h10 TaxID=930991 RepID=A0A0D0DFB4_9AGAM|nr:hypothetical protein PAXRUDRAFT_36366 [Paxillus rubicundulus Ve08.2h10]